MILSKIRVGGRCVVTKICISNPALKRRLVDFGLTKGTIIKISGVAPLGDPIKIRLRGFDLALRLSVADKIEVREIFY